MWTTIVKTVLKCCDAWPWTSSGIAFIVAVLPFAQGAFHYYGPTAKGLTEPKMLFGKVKINGRLYSALQIMLFLLVLSVAADLMNRYSRSSFTSDADRVVMVMLFVTAGLYSAGEAVGYYGSKIADLASQLPIPTTTNDLSEK